MRIINMSKIEKRKLLDIRDLSVVIERDEGIVRPLNGVSFSIQPGQSIGIVGESGCGKSTFLDIVCGSVLSVWAKRPEIKIRILLVWISPLIAESP